MPGKIKDTVMRADAQSTLDIFVEKGRKEEREKTARNLIRISSLSDEQIAAATDLPLDYVSRIRKELESRK